MSTPTYDVMISLHCASMAPSALSLKSYLGSFFFIYGFANGFVLGLTHFALYTERFGLSIFVCMEMNGGTQYRHEIVSAVESCKFFVILLNEQWALSGECEDEFSLAKRMNLTSHETHRTERTDERLPIMIPIAFPNLDWNKHSHVKLLAAKVNFIVHDSDDLVSGNFTSTGEKVAHAIRNAAVKGVELHELGTAAGVRAFATFYCFIV